MTTLLSNRNRVKISEEDVDVLKVMAHPVRLQIVNELMHHKMCNVTQLTKILKLPQSTVSQHLSKLKGTVLRAERRGLEMHYYIDNAKARQIIGILGFKVHTT
ncbi:ArsR/SmtB family transcription factor [Bacillus toyonensis]|nr:metalloregulator ArsR/SmtB family transcription factor [Bacillus toyonensis]PGC86348.1 transcriptional regulator [Bacillus toyonensis]